MLGFYPDSRIVPHLLSQDSADLFWVLWSTQLAEISSFVCVYVCVCLFTDFWRSTLTALAELGECPWPGQQCLPRARQRMEGTGAKADWGEQAGNHRIGTSWITFDTSQEGSCVRGRGTAPWDWEMLMCAAVTHPRQLHLDVLPFLSSQTWQMPRMKLFLLWLFLTAPTTCAGFGIGLTLGYFQR